MIAESLARQLPDDAVNLDFRADIDPARRLIENEHGPCRDHPAAEQNLLLVAAGEIGDRRVGPVAAIE